MHRFAPALVLFGLAACSQLELAVRPKGALLSWNHYHSNREIAGALRLLCTKHSDMAELEQIGRSVQGRPIWAVTINNPETGPAEEKAAFYCDGGIHGDELLAGEAALYLVDLLLEHYELEPAIKELVDRHAFYIVPVVNPDGRELTLNSGFGHRWNARPVDEDGDGLVDEDPADDLDGDGRVLSMRVVNPDGEWQLSDSDPRLLVRRRQGSTGGRYFDVYREGQDDDGDGQFNEDRVGGYDLNRNFPANWLATQKASGTFPLSEPETHALLSYLGARPNVALIHTFHTSGGMVLRFPTPTGVDGDYPGEDLADYAELGALGATITGYENLARDKAAITARMQPGYGVFNDWASREFGVLALTTEMWGHPTGGMARLRWADENLGDEGFVDWYAFEHPQLGTVELGGLPRERVQNPPPTRILPELERNGRWMLALAGRMPHLAVRKLDVARESGEEPIYSINAEVENRGWMATSTAHARDVLGTAQTAHARLELTNAELVDGDARPDLGHFPGRRNGANPRIAVASWRVRVLDPEQPASVTVVAQAQKGGTARWNVELK